MKDTKDLTKQPPRSPRARLANYIILARMADKGRAEINGTIGEYHFDCPLDNRLFGFKGVKGAAVKTVLESGATDEQLVNWFNTHGTPKTPEEIKNWSDTTESYNPYNDPKMKEWFVKKCKGVGIDPAASTLFDYLEADDKLSFTAVK